MSGWLHAHFHPATRKLASVSRHYKGQRRFALAHRLARAAQTQFCVTYHLFNLLDEIYDPSPELDVAAR